jgi:hypothetical protein
MKKPDASLRTRPALLVMILTGIYDGRVDAETFIQEGSSYTAGD